jgi:hypothetical protein
LANLPGFHSRVQMLFPKLQPPGFECMDVMENSLKLHYRTRRAGLVHFVIGLMQELATCSIRRLLSTSSNLKNKVQITMFLMSSGRTTLSNETRQPSLNISVWSSATVVRHSVPFPFSIEYADGNTAGWNNTTTYLC